MSLVLFWNTSVISVQGQDTMRAVPSADSVQEQTGGIDLVGQIGGALANVVIQGDYAYLAVGSRVVVVDVSTPTQSTFVGQTDALPNSVSALAIKNNHAYATAGDTLYVFSVEVKIAHHQVVLTRQGSYQEPSGYSATDVVVQGNYAYVTFATGGTLLLKHGLLDVIDISNPAAPSRVGWDGSSYHPEAIAISGHNVYVAGGNLIIYDVSDPFFPIEKGSYFDAHTNIEDIAVVGQYVYTSNFGGDEFRVIDVSDPSQPRQVGSYDLPWGAARGMVVVYPYAYVTDTDGGLRILSVTNPAHPTEEGAYDLSTNAQGPHLSAREVAVAGPIAYVNIGGNDLHIVNISNRAAPAKIASYSNFLVTDPVSVKVVGALAYVADASAGLDILNVANPVNPQVVGHWVPNNHDLHPLDVAVAGHYAYLLTDFGVHVIDITNASAPREVSHYDDPYGGLTYITVAGNYAYVIAQGSGLMILDVSNPASPRTMIRRYNFNGRLTFLSRPIARDTKLYVTSGCSLRVLDISDPAHPTQQTSKDIPGCAEDLALATYPRSRDDYLYIAEEPLHGLTDGGLRIVRLEDLSDVGYYQPPRTNAYDSYRPNFVAVANQEDKAYMIEQAKPGDDWVYTLRLVDLHDLAHPALIGTIRLPNRVGIPAAAGDYAFVPAGKAGLVVFRRGYSYSATIGAAGGHFMSNMDRTSYSFVSGTFLHPTKVTHTILLTDEVPAHSNLIGIGHFYQVSAQDIVTGQAVQPSQPYTVVIRYTESQKGAAIESSLALYSWNGAHWVKEPTGFVDPIAHVISATPNHFSKWAVLGETLRGFLPLVVSNR